MRTQFSVEYGRKAIFCEECDIAQPTAIGDFTSWAGVLTAGLKVLLLLNL